MGGVQYFFVLPQDFESFPSGLPRAGWCDLVCVECLQIIKPMVQFQVSKMSLAVFQGFKDA